MGCPSQRGEQNDFGTRASPSLDDESRFSTEKNLKRVGARCLHGRMHWLFALRQFPCSCALRNQSRLHLEPHPRHDRRSAMTVVPKTGRPRISPLGLGFLAVTSVGWGLNFPIMKYLLTEWPPLSSRGLTGIAGSAALALIAVLQRQLLTVPRNMRLRLMLVSLLTIS